MSLSEAVARAVSDARDRGITAGQIARALGAKRSTVSVYLWALKKAGRIKQIGRNLWTVSATEGATLVTRDPFTLPLREFVKLSKDEFFSLQAEAVRRCEHEVRGAWRRGVRQVALACGRIVAEANGTDGITPMRASRLSKQLAAPVYVVSSPDVVEEARWTPVADDDYYPTLRIALGAPSWRDHEVFQQGVIVNADFDTGNPTYAIFDERDVAGVLPAPDVFTLRSATHVGLPYQYFVAEVKVGISDARSVTRVLRRLARFVFDWRRSPLLLPSPHRRGFVGRDLMLRFPLRVGLNPRKKRSDVLLQ